jgi:hypothetical protein
MDLDSDTLWQTNSKSDKMETRFTFLSKQMVTVTRVRVLEHVTARHVDRVPT